jgi:hypothetical protein
VFVYTTSLTALCLSSAPMLNQTYGLNDTLRLSPIAHLTVTGVSLDGNSFLRFLRSEQLESLCLSNCDLQHAPMTLFDSLAQTPRLRTFRGKRLHKLTADQLAGLVEAAPQLTELELSDCADLASPQCLRPLAGLAQLRTLDLCGAAWLKDPIDLVTLSRVCRFSGVRCSRSLVSPAPRVAAGVSADSGLCVVVPVGLQLTSLHTLAVNGAVEPSLCRAALGMSPKQLAIVDRSIGEPIWAPADRFHDD